MTTPRRYAPGEFCWLDLNTLDPAGAKAFYTKLLGWEVLDLPLPGGSSFSMFQIGGKSLAALMPLPEAARQMGARPHWMNYVAVADADQVARRVQQLGGSILLAPGDVGPRGRMAIVADPAGAVFGLWQAGTHAGFEVEGEPFGQICWHELMTPDMAVAKTFYTELFGYSTTEMSTEGGHPYTIFLTQDPEHPREAGMMPIPDGSDAPTSWLAYVWVQDCDRTAHQAVELGGQVLVPPCDIPPGRFAVLQDPQGAVFALLQGR